jgi:hypothetical protein
MEQLEFDFVSGGEVMTEDEKIYLWDQFAMEFFRARMKESILWTPEALSAGAYRYANAMMAEREAQLAYRAAMKDQG